MKLRPSLSIICWRRKKFFNAIVSKDKTNQKRMCNNYTKRNKSLANVCHSDINNKIMSDENHFKHFVVFGEFIFPKFLVQCGAFASEIKRISVVKVLWFELLLAKVKVTIHVSVAKFNACMWSCFFCVNCDVFKWETLNYIYLCLLCGCIYLKFIFHSQKRVCVENIVECLFILLLFLPQKWNNLKMVNDPADSTSKIHNMLVYNQ